MPVQQKIDNHQEDIIKETAFFNQINLALKVESVDRSSRMWYDINTHGKKYGF